MGNSSRTEAALIEQRLIEIFTKDEISSEDLKKTRMWFTRWKSIKNWKEDSSPVLIGISNYQILGWSPPDESYGI
jgi:hypothetical protein